MTYHFESRSDFSEGAMLVLQFPESQLDEKALRTIQEDPPSFLVPFRVRTVGEQVECVYYLQNRSKLPIWYRMRDKQSYVLFWRKLLDPLLECADWFLKPGSFVMDPQYIFATANAQEISYLYIPTREDCSDRAQLQAMAVEISSKNGVSDAALENQVLRNIMMDFQPKAFLQMLQETVKEETAAQPPVSQPVQQSAAQPAPQAVVQPMPQPVTPVQPPASQPFEPGDIVIRMTPPESEKKGLFGSKKKEKEKEKAQKPAKEKGRLFGGKKSGQRKELVLGAAPQPAQPVAPAAPAVPIPAAPAPVMEPDCEATQIDDGTPFVGLFLVGHAQLPREIPVAIGPGEIFTIGRFDITVGKQQSSFEFDKNTKAVSRHHAAIERNQSGYQIVDLSSTAGTFLNGARMVANTPYPLTAGLRVSFGTCGAVYEWRE